MPEVAGARTSGQLSAGPPGLSANMRRHVVCAVLLPLCSLLAARPESIGPFGGSAAVVQVDTHRPGVVLAATSNALLFQSANDGNSWTRVPFPPELRARLHAFVVVPRTGVYLAGLGDDTHEYSGIFRSDDAGRSWRRLMGLGHRNIWSIALWPLDGEVIAAGAEDGVFLSRDGGEHWARSSPESHPALKPVVALAFDTTKSQVVYAGTPHLPWKTVDGGMSWEPANIGMHDDSDVFSIHVDETRPLQLFASACSGIYRSADQGASWKKIPEASGVSSRTYKITQDPTQPNIMFAGTANGLVKSVDRGTTWRRLFKYPTRWITFDPAHPGRIFVATEEGLFRSDDLGESLYPVNEGFCNRRVLSFAASGKVLFASSATSSAASKILRRADSDSGWQSLVSGSELLGRQVIKIVSLDDERLYALTTESLLLTSDSGRTWAAVPLPATTSKLTTLLVPADGDRILVGAEGGVYYSHDAGKTWLKARLPKGQLPIRSLILLGSQSVAAITPSTVLVSWDGIDYEAVTSPLGGADFYGLVATDKALLAATSLGLLRSDDFGASWRGTPGVLNGRTVSAISKHPTDPGVLFASCYGAVFRSVDNGHSWTSLTKGEGEVAFIRELVVAAGIPDRLFAITHNHGILTLSLQSEPSCPECNGSIAEAK